MTPKADFAAAAVLPRRHGGILPARAVVQIVIWALAIAVAFLIVYPILSAILRTFLRDGSLYLEPFGAVARSRGIDVIIRNTAVYTVLSTLTAVAIGGLFAWVNERTDARINRLATITPILPLMVPPMGTAVGFVILLSDQTGALNLALRALFGLTTSEGPILIQNMLGLSIITAMTFAPINYLMIASALKNLDPTLEEASRIFGLSPIRTFLKVTLPAIVPAIASSMLLVAVHVMSAFTYPFILGANAGVTTISVYIYRRFSAFPPSPDTAMAAGVLMLLVVYVALVLQIWIARRSSFHTISGKHAQFTRVAMGRWKTPLRMLMVLYLVIVALPIVGLVIGAAQPYLGASHTQYSLRNLRSVLGDDTLLSALWNSFSLSLVAATAVILVAALLLYGTARIIRRGEAVADFVMMTPSAIPQIIIGVTFIISFSGPPFYLFGTKLLVVLAYFVLFIPDAARAAAAALSQVSEQLSEAAHISGAGVGRVLHKIVLPQAASGLFGGWLIVFLLALNEVTVSAFLGGVNSRVIGQVSVDYFANGRLGEVATLGLIVTVVTFATVAAGHRLVGAVYKTR